MNGKEPEWISEKDSTTILELQETSYIHVKDRAFDVIRACIAAFSVIIIGVSFIQSEWGFPTSPSDTEIDQIAADIGFDPLTVLFLYLSTIFSVILLLLVVLLFTVYAINLLSGLSTREMLDLTVPHDDLKVADNNVNRKTTLPCSRYEYWLKKRGEELERASEELIAGQKLILWSFSAGSILVVMYLFATNLELAALLYYHIILSIVGILILASELLSRVSDVRGFTEMIRELPDPFMPSRVYGSIIWPMLGLSYLSILLTFAYYMYSEVFFSLIL